MNIINLIERAAPMKRNRSLIHALAMISLLRWATCSTESLPVDLTGKMLTLSRNGVSFSSSTPSSPSPSPWWRTTPSSPSPSPYPWWRTTASITSPPKPSPSVSVCLRFVTDQYVEVSLGSLSMGFGGLESWLRVSYYSPQLSFRSDRLLWLSVRQYPPWSSVCMVLDGEKGVAQVFQGGAMSLRKIVPGQSRWDVQGALLVNGFEGQLTDLHVWDVPLSYRTVRGYMSNTRFPSGTILSWSHISFHPDGQILLEDSYDNMEYGPITGTNQALKRNRKWKLYKKYRVGQRNNFKGNSKQGAVKRQPGE